MGHRFTLVLGLCCVAGCNGVLDIRQPADAVLQPDAGATVQAATSQKPPPASHEHDSATDDEDAGARDEDAGR